MRRQTPSMRSVRPSLRRRAGEVPLPVAVTENDVVILTETSSSFEKNWPSAG